MVARIAPTNTAGIWRGFAVGAVTIPNGKKFKDYQAFEKFVKDGWVDLNGKPLKGTPEIQVPLGGSFTIKVNTKLLGTAEWIDGFNKKSPFAATRTADGIKLTASKAQKDYAKTDVLALKTGPLVPGLPVNHKFEFKVHDGMRILMG